MTILILKGVNDEDPKSFLNNYKKTCINTGVTLQKIGSHFYWSFLKKEFVNGMRDNQRLTSYFGNIRV